MISPQAAMDIEESGLTPLDLRVESGQISLKAALLEQRRDFWGALREESPHIAFEAASTLLPELKGCLVVLKPWPTGAQGGESVERSWSRKHNHRAEFDCPDAFKLSQIGMV